METYTKGAAWKVTFRRYRLTPSYKAESLIVFADEERLQLLFDAVLAIHPEATVDAAERLGEAVRPS